MAENHKLEIIEDFSRHFCIVCKNRIIVGCGTPVVHIGGCCSRIEDDEEKIVHIVTLKSHYHCYDTKIRVNEKVKTVFGFKEIKKIVLKEKLRERK